MAAKFPTRYPLRLVAVFPGGPTHIVYGPQRKLGPFDMLHRDHMLQAELVIMIELDGTTRVVKNRFGYTGTLRGKKKRAKRTR